MLVNLNNICKPAQKHGYAVGIFNTVNYEMVSGPAQAGAFVLLVLRCNMKLKG
jgi:fructose/tagatose bisphosphate aldolase